MIEKPRPDLLTLSTTFYDVSVLCNRFLKAQKAQIWQGGNAGVKKLRKILKNWTDNMRKKTVRKSQEKLVKRGGMVREWSPVHIYIYLLAKCRFYLELLLHKGVFEL